ncbi:MAG: hypothetical protein QE271_01615 [Bacteriovoracaceae bacterium]|nr:hypothetical protein [Bacteriovoracaceae bacterium]
MNLKDIAELFLAGINPSALTKILLNADGYLNFIASIFNDHDLWAHGSIMYSPLIPSQIYYPLQRFLALQGNLEKLRNIYLTEMDKANKTKIFADFFKPILYFFSKGHERGSQFQTLLTQIDINRILDYLNDPNFYGGTEPWKSMNLSAEVPDTFDISLMEGFSIFEKAIHNLVNCSTGNCDYCTVK